MGAARLLFVDIDDDEAVRFVMYSSAQLVLLSDAKQTDRRAHVLVIRTIGSAKLRRSCALSLSLSLTTFVEHTDRRVRRDFLAKDDVDVV